jgi:hypothetical protein
MEYHLFTVKLRALLCETSNFKYLTVCWIRGSATSNYGEHYLQGFTWSSFLLAYSSTMKMQAIWSSEMPVNFFRTMADSGTLRKVHNPDTTGKFEK